MRRRIFFHGIFVAMFILSLQPALGAGERLISMDLEAADLKDVLKIFSQQSGLNFVASQEIETKKVTVFLQGVSVQDALDAIIKANSLRYDQKPGSKVFAVYQLTDADVEQTLRTRVFHLKYMTLSISPLDVGGQKVVQDLSQKDEISGSSSSQNSSDSSSGGSQGQGNQQGGNASGNQQSAASASPSNLTAQKGADKLVASILSKNGKVTVDLHTNSLIVTDTPEKLAEVEKVLAKLDVPAAQVMLEVYVMEVRKDLLDDIGVDWGGANGSLVTFTSGSRTTGFPFTENLFNKSKGVKATTQPASALALGSVSAANLTATLHFLMNHTDTKILARPRVLTESNEAANIKLVTNAAIANTTSTTASQGIATSTSNQAERTEVGISLKMTPQINDDDSISLYVEPAVTTVAVSQFFSTTFLDPTTRSVRTTARVKNHETLVIGGLIDSSQSLSKKKIPFLGDMPFMGSAFRYDNGDAFKRELLIFVTPHIVEGYDSLTEESATTGGKELAVKRMLDSFATDHVSEMMDPLSAVEKEKEGLYKQQRHLIETSQKRTLKNPLVEKKMSQALDSFSPKSSKLSQ